MTFILLGPGTQQEKVLFLYENLDWQCRGYVHKSMIRLFLKNFCVVAAEVVPYYAQDTYLSTVDLKDMVLLWNYGIGRAPDHLTRKTIRDWPRLNKSEFISTFDTEKYKFLFNATLLRRWLVKSYEDEYREFMKTSPKKQRMSVYANDEINSPEVKVIKKSQIDVNENDEPDVHHESVLNAPQTNEISEPK